MATSQMHQVAEGSLKKTREGELEWITSSDKASRYSELPDGLKLVITRLSWFPGPPPKPPALSQVPDLPDLGRATTYGFRLELYGRDGSLVGSIAATSGDLDYGMLREIYETADELSNKDRADLDRAIEFLTEPTKSSIDQESP